MTTEHGAMSEQSVDTQQINQPIDLPEYVRKEGPEIDVNDVDAILSHPGPIMEESSGEESSDEELQQLEDCLDGVMEYGESQDGESQDPGALLHQLLDEMLQKEIKKAEALESRQRSNN